MTAIFGFMRKRIGFVIITKDDDFEQTSVLLGHPPKVIWVRLGNCRTSDVVALIRKSQKVITAFAEDEEKSILPLP
jgi:predicted nuclease of predicted toxin-antitoxin system